MKQVKRKIIVALLLFAMGVRFPMEASGETLNAQEKQV